MLSPCSTEIMILILLLRFIYVRYASGLVRDQGRLLHLLGENWICYIYQPINTTPVLGKLLSTINIELDILVAILTGAFYTNRALTRPLREIWTGTLYMNMLKELIQKSIFVWKTKKAGLFGKKKQCNDPLKAKKVFWNVSLDFCVNLG